MATWGRPMPCSFPALITTSCQLWSCWTYPLQYYSVFAADTTLWPWFLTFDLEHLQCIACDVMKLCTKFECNRAICGSGVIAISIFDLMTLNIALRVALGSGIIFTKFDLRQIMNAWINVFYAGTLCHAVTLTTFSRAILWSGALLTNSYQGCVDPTQLHQTWRGHRAIIAALQFCFRVRMPGCIFKRGRLKFEWCWKRR